MLLIGTKNIASQTVLTDELINIGSIYRKYCKKNRCGVPAFSQNGNGITLQQSGIYHITAVLVGTGTVAGDVTVQLLKDGIAIPGILSTQTITTAETETRTFVLDAYILVDDDCVLGNQTTDAKTISLQNTGVGATFTSVVLNIDKVV